MIKKIFSALVVVLFATSMMAQSGLTCEEPIKIDSNYVGRVEGPCEMWYTAGTYDLPLNVHFIPDNYDSETSPEVMIDLTCTPGVYDDPLVDSLLTMVEDFGISFPIEMWCDSKPNGDRMEYDLFVDDMYREQMAEFGVTYNVQAFVKVTFYEAGTISLRPDLTFADCVNNSEHVVLDDTLDILPDDRQRVFIMPYTDWQNDSIQFVWTGEEPVTVWIASDNCDFNPSTTSGYVWDNYVVTKNQPYKLSNQRIVDAIKNNSGGGLLYAKVVSASAGKLVVENIPLPKPKGNATLLEYGQSVSIDANDTALYCFPATWTSTQFVASTASAITMYASAQPVFGCSTDDVNVLAVYPFYKNNNVSELSLSTREMSSLTYQAQDNYIYVRFQSKSATTISPNAWVASECADKSLSIVSGNAIKTTTSTANTIYRWRYDDWKNNDMDIYWGGARGNVTVYMVDTCSFTTASLVLQTSINSKQTITMDVATMASWADRIDPDGYLYVRFKPQSSGDITFTSAKPITPDPVYSTIDATLCYGEVYEWNGQTYTATGEYTQTLVAANGADSIVTLKLTIRPEVAAVEEKDTVCYGESYTWQGTTYTKSGEYSTTLQDENGCDYQAVLNLTVLPEVAAVEEKATVCYGESYTWQGTTYTKSGEYSTTLQDEHGCDYQAVLNLTVLPEVAATTETVEVPFGETYEWHGVTYVESGEYTITLQDANGCDYQATLHLTVLPEPEKTDLLPNDAMSVSLPTALNVYAMDYAAWKAQDVKWQWTGSTPLYVFVAKSSDYALTPQNRHVLLFAPIEPGEEIVLTKEQVSAWESLAEGGMIYVRLLTEKSGQLTTVAE